MTRKIRATFMLTISDTVVATMQQGSPIAVSGTFTVDSSTIEVTVTDTQPPQAAAAFSNLLSDPQDLTWKLMGNELKVSSPLLPVLLGPTHTELTLTKEMASTASSR